MILTHNLHTFLDIMELKAQNKKFSLEEKNCLSNKFSDSWKNGCKMVSEDNQKYILKSTKNMQLSTIAGEFRGLNDSSYHIYEDIFDNKFFLSFKFSFDNKTLGGLET